MDKSALQKILSKLSLRKSHTSNFDDYFALYDKGSYREAYDVLRGILQSNAHWSKVGDMYVWCADLELLVNHDVCKARQLLDKALKLGCHFMANYYRTHGSVLWRSGERSSGIEELEKSVALDPCITNLTTLGKVLTSSDDKHAMSIWRRVLEKDPNNCSAHIYLGRESAKSGDQGQAILMAKKAERLKPTVRNFVEIGCLYRELEQFQNALNAYLQAHKLGYESKGPLYASISTCYFAMGEKKLAQKYIQWALRYSPEDDFVKEVWQEYKERFDVE
jgi:tetratricopeptide (TPR) repeat protein